MNVAKKFLLVAPFAAVTVFFTAQANQLDTVIKKGVLCCGVVPDFRCDNIGRILRSKAIVMIYNIAQKNYQSGSFPSLSIHFKVFLCL